MLNKIKKFFIKTDTLRERIEDRLADVLEKVDGSESIDKLEQKVIKQAIQTAGQYYGVSIPDEISNTVAEESTKCLGKINQKLQNQLRK